MIAEGWLDRFGRRGARARPRGSARRRTRRPPLRALARWLTSPAGRRLLVALVTVLALLAGAWLWLRDSSLVAIKRVTVGGASGPDAAQIRSALVAAARNMTTLDVKLGQLNMAVEPYPVVKSLRVTTQFPHGMRIQVIEEIPVAAIDIGGRNVAVAGDGTLLKDGSSTGPLPVIPLRFAPGGSRLSDPGALAAVRLLAAAPYQLLGRVSQATSSSAHGLEAQLRNGPSIYFGTAQRLGAKWIAATALLAQSSSAGSQYIDVTDPVRAAAGAVPPSSTATGAATTGAPASASSGSASGASAGAASAAPTGAAGTPTGG